MKDEFYEFIGPRLDTRSAKDKTQMLIDGFEKFQKNFELSDEEIDTLKITFIKEIFANSKFLLNTIFCGVIDLIFTRKMPSQIFLKNSKVLRRLFWEWLLFKILSRRL